MFFYLFMIPILGNLAIAAWGHIDGHLGRVRMTGEGYSSYFLEILRREMNRWDWLQYLLLDLFNRPRYRKLQRIINNYRLAREEQTAFRQCRTESSGYELIDLRREQKERRTLEKLMESRRELLIKGRNIAGRIEDSEEAAFRRRSQHLLGVRLLAGAYLHAAGFSAEDDILTVFDERAKTNYEGQRERILREYRHVLFRSVNRQEEEA